MTASIIVDGKPFAIEARVRTWHEVPALAFPALGKRRQTNAVTLHHTGGEGDSTQVHATLIARKLSVHFAIDRDGLITQYCDAAMLCAHAKGYNAASIGIEIVNAAGTKPGKYGRALLHETVHGVAAVRETFLPAQVTAALVLIETLCRAYGLPMQVPMAGKDVRQDVLSDAEKAAWRGVVGHLQVDPQKIDPGIALLRAVAAHPLRAAQKDEP